MIRSTVPEAIISRMLGWAWETRLTRLHCDARLLEHVAGAGGGKELDAHLLKAPGDAHDLLLVLVLDGDDDTAATLGHLHDRPP